MTTPTVTFESVPMLPLHVTPCAVDACRLFSIGRQAFRSPSGEICSVPLCDKHYGLSDIMAGSK